MQDAPLKERQGEYLISHLRAPAPSYLSCLYRAPAADAGTVNLKSHTGEMQSTRQARLPLPFRPFSPLARFCPFFLR